MNPEIKQKWIDALRSGEYKQGKQQLRKENTFCCLGVLCDLYQKEHPESFWQNGVFFVGNDERNEQYLPSTVKKWADLDSANPYATGKDGTVVYLSTANDIEDLSFEEIADIIEEGL